MAFGKRSSLVRPLAVIAILIVVAYWAGARWGPRGPVNVEAVPPMSGDSGSVRNVNLAERDAALSNDEVLNVRIYRQTSPAVANVLTKATEYDFWMDPVPVEGAGSGFVIDNKGYVLTNFHVVQGAQSIEVVLGDQSRYPAKFIGADQRNDVALLKIEPNSKPLVALPLGDSAALQVGQKVLAIGNPFGFQSTLQPIWHAALYAASARLEFRNFACAYWFFRCEELTALCTVSLFVRLTKRSASRVGRGMRVPS
jgi:S1-C subfamily serine protease